MADGGKAKLELGDKISKDDLKCSICHNFFNQPKILDCLHGFCMECLQLYREKRGPKNKKLECSLCRGETTLTENGVSGLRNGFKLSALVEEATMQEKLHGQRSEIKCQACDEGNLAISRCMDCDHFLCQECQQAHERMALMKSHQIFTLGQLRSGEIQYKSKLREYIPKCREHTYQNVSLYCNTCEKFVCVLCIVLTCSHLTPKHSLVDMHEASEKCKQEVDKLVEEYNKNKRELTTAINDIEISRRKLQSTFDKTKDKISKKAEKEVAKIKEEENKLMEEAYKIYTERIQNLKTAQAKIEKEVTHKEQKVYVVKRRLDLSNSYEIVNLRQKLIGNLQELGRRRPQKVSDRLSFMGFEESEKSLGRLVLQDDEPIMELKAQAVESSPTPTCKTMRPKEMWYLKAEIIKKKEYTFYDAAAFTNNEIVIADALFKGVTLADSKPQSTVIPQRLNINDLTSFPQHVSVDKDDQIIVLDDHKVKIFNKKGNLLHQFTPGTRGVQNSKPTCLAVDNKLIAVGYQSKQEISLHNLDGSLIKTLHAPMIDQYLTICKQRLIYTNWGMKKLRSIDYNGGGMLFSVNINYENPCKTGPNGVCCDSDGSIYVAVWINKSGEIQHYSPDGEYIGCAIKECARPRGIALTPSGDMVVTAGHSTLCFSRVKNAKKLKPNLAK